MKEDNTKNGLLIIILLGVASIFVLFFPKIYDLVSSFSMPKVENFENEEKEEEVKKIDEVVLETIHYPLMRKSTYDANTYYSLDKFTINDLSNNDILLNAFLDIYEGNMTSYDGVAGCTSVSKQFDVSYLELRIKNIVNDKINYTLEDFYVPEDLNTNYPGTWVYDSYFARYIYDGLCQSQSTYIRYYDLEELIKVEYDDNDINAYYYVGFAKVEGDNYIIYKDANLTEELTSGAFTSEEELNNIFKNINKDNKKIYKYTFKNTLCSYNEYCLYEGKWVNEF